MNPCCNVDDAAVRSLALCLVLLLTLSFSVGSALIDEDNGAAVRASPQCAFLANMNISSADMSSPKFVVSALDCCQLCANTVGCLASVFSSYYCHLKADATPEPSSAATIVVAQSVTTTTSTTLPTTTNVPATTAAPTTTTVAPSTPTVTMIRQVSCQSSPNCNRTLDPSCVTNVFLNNTCRDQSFRVCNTARSDLLVDTYADDSCAGELLNNVTVPVGSCRFDNGAYFGMFCDVVPVPIDHVEVSRIVCTDSCATTSDEGGSSSSGADCTTASFRTGECVNTQQFEGYYTIASCVPSAGYIVYDRYMSAGCTGPIQFSTAEPLGAGQCFQTADQDSYIENICMG